MKELYPCGTVILSNNFITANGQDIGFADDISYERLHRNLSLGSFAPYESTPLGMRTDNLLGGLSPETWGYAPWRTDILLGGMSLGATTTLPLRTDIEVDIIIMAWYPLDMT